MGAVVACRRAGARRILVTARGFGRDVDPEDWPRASELSRLGAELLPWPGTSFDPGQLEGIQLLVQATSAGMQGADSGEAIARLVPWRGVPRLGAYDLVYNPEQTPFLLAAAECGHLARGGLGMLVRQAALALEIWWGVLPPLAPLREAAERGLAARSKGESGDAG